MTKKSIPLVAFSVLVILMGCNKKTPSPSEKNREALTSSAQKIDNEITMRYSNLLTNENSRTSLHIVTYPYDDFGTITSTTTEISDTITITFVDGTQRIFTNSYDTGNTTGDDEITEYRQVEFANITTKIKIIESTSLHDEPTYRFYSPTNSTIHAVLNPSTLTLLLSRDLCIHVRDSMLMVMDFSHNTITSIFSFNPENSQLIPLESDSVSATFALTSHDSTIAPKFVRIHKTGVQWMTDTIQ